MEDSIKIKGWVEYKHFEKLNGVKFYISRFINLFSNNLFSKYINKYSILKDSGIVYNTIMKAGYAQMALLAGDASAVPFTKLALGTSNTAVVNTQTSLGGEITDSGLQRVSATVSRVTTTETNDTLQLFYSFTITGSKTVEEAGVFNDPTSGTMLSRLLTGSKTFSSGEIYELTYKIKFSA